MKASENKPPATIPAKGKYMFKHDLPNLARLFNVPSFQSPVSFPQNSIKAQRALTAIKMSGNVTLLISASRAFWSMVWHDGKSIEDESELAEYLKVHAPDAVPYLSKINDQDVKDELVRVTKIAADSGSFGAPWMVVEINGKMNYFWGSDRLECLACAIGKPWYGPDPSRATPRL